jgi:hypothetical protein
MRNDLYRHDHEWKQTREIVAMIYNTNVKKGRQKKASKLYPLPSDTLFDRYDKYDYEQAKQRAEHFRKIWGLK